MVVPSNTVFFDCAEMKKKKKKKKNNNDTKYILIVLDLFPSHKKLFIHPLKKSQSSKFL